MARRLIDLSVPLQNTVYADPPGHGPAIEYMGHDQSVGDILKFFPGLKKCPPPAPMRQRGVFHLAARG